MNRRKLVSATGAASLTAAAVVVAVGANYSLFGLTPGDAKAGHLAPIAATNARHPDPTTRTEITYFDTPAPTPSAEPSTGTPPAGGEHTGDENASASATDAPDAPDPEVAPAPQPTPTPTPPPTVATDGRGHGSDDTAAQPGDTSGTEPADD